MKYVKEFIGLFEGNPKTYGQHDPNRPKENSSHTIHKKANPEVFQKHLAGEIGIGQVPIMDSGTCSWGAIDIDCHDGKVLNIELIAKTIYAKGIPLIACRSKSGGVHCYIFTSEPVPAYIVRRALKTWAKDIGHEGSEVFPKQSELKDNENGNWINLPYFGGDDTNRYAMGVNDGVVSRLKLQQFINYAEQCKLDAKMLRSFILSGHEQAPPCLQELIIEGVPKGKRNEALYAFTIYIRKKYPAANYRQHVLELNNRVFERPLPISEANKTIQSASRREYKYRCTEEPCRSHCNSKVCLTREYGIEPSDSFETGEGLPEFTRLRVINTEPPLWEITVNDVAVVVNTRTLRNFQYLAEEIMERLLVVIPLLKQKEWMPMLAELMNNVEHIEAPDNASVEGIIREKLAEFISRADFNNNGKDKNDKDLILRGLPVVQEDADEGVIKDGKRVVMFKGTDFIAYLKRTRSEELKGNALWMALRKMGVTHTRTRIGGKTKNVWIIPIDGKGRTKLDYDYDPERKFIHADPEKVVQIVNKLNF